MRVDRTDNTPLHALARWRAGESLRQTKLNATVDTLNAIRQGVRPPRQVRPPSGGAAEAAALGITQVYFNDEYTDDGIICLRNRDDPESILEVLRPYDLRKTPWHNLTIDGRTYAVGVILFDGAPGRIVTMTIEGTQYEERQFMQPAYRLGEPIIAAQIGEDAWVEIGSARRWMRAWTELG